MHKKVETEKKNKGNKTNVFYWNENYLKKEIRFLLVFLIKKNLIEKKHN